MGSFWLASWCSWLFWFDEYRSLLEGFEQEINLPKKMEKLKRFVVSTSHWYEYNIGSKKRVTLVFQQFLWTKFCLSKSVFQIFYKKKNHVRWHVVIIWYLVCEKCDFVREKKNVRLMNIISNKFTTVLWRYSNLFKKFVDFDLWLVAIHSKQKMFFYFTFTFTISNLKS